MYVEVNFMYEVVCWVFENFVVKVVWSNVIVLRLGIFVWLLIYSDEWGGFMEYG